jgi:GNAT superfamily N-acetyltransferase
MADVQIHRFTPDDPHAVREALRLRNAARAVDSPWNPPTLPDEYDGMLRHGWDGEPVVPYLMTVDGRSVGLGTLSLSERENTHLAWLSVTIDPECRRRGHGQQLFDRLVEETRAAGRTSIGADAWDGSAGVAFAMRQGLEKKSQAVQRRQLLSEIEDGLVQKLYDEAARAASDYELLRLVGPTPPEMTDAVVELMAAINDAPTDDLDIEDEVFTPDRLAAYEKATAAQGQTLYRVIARHRGSGELGGHTVVGVETERPTAAHQHDTAVARAHRGHRLGLLLKSAMLLWLAEAEPQIETVDTWNAESNDHMIGVNELLGYRVMARELQLQMTL